jgi:hypothetical protein
MPAAPLVGAVTTRPPAAFFVDGQRVEVHPVHHLQRSRSAASGLAVRLACSGRAALDLEAAGQDALGLAAALHGRITPQIFSSPARVSASGANGLRCAA